MFRTLPILIALLVIPVTTTLAAEKPLTPAQIKELDKKATNGDLRAQTELAERYYKGDGLKQDPAQAARWYKTLADKGVANAQLTLGLMYIQGTGVEKNDKEAITWLTRAAEQKIIAAQYLLGVAHAEGHGVKQDLIKAFMWYEIAASMDYQNAITARQELAKKLSPKEIAQAEQMATEWWLRFHN